ncbi:hypothetical protein JX266_008197 [Neoarthrinium moseri]|nr:hypothetical protein JX266_008197 [Neoarthrinium moseri]
MIGKPERESFRPVDLDDSESEYFYAPPKTIRNFIRSRSCIVAGCLSSFLIVVILLSNLYGKSPAITSCGNTPEEARARGCRFESHNFAWTPPECYDEYLNTEWDSKDWGYSRNGEGTDLIPQSEVLEGNLEWAYVTLNQHLTHCVLIWQKYQRAVMFDRPTDNWTSSFAHTYHCGHLLVQWDSNHSTYDSLLNTKYVSCDYRWKNPDPSMYDSFKGKLDGGLIGDGGNHADTAGRTKPDHS